MNYRHAYHAGNFADVMKHAILVRVIEYLKRKEKPFRVIDTHAGVGLYSLSSEQAQKTGEWQNGIGRLLTDPPTGQAANLLEPFLQVVRRFNNGDGGTGFYPGSPMIIRHLLRKQDRLTAIELHPEDASLLRQNFEGDHQVRVIEIDGWLALGGHLPPKERRGLVMVDPPFEKEGEFARLIDGLKKAYRRWPGGIYAFWYPIKNRQEVGHFRKELAESGIPDILDIALTVRVPGLEARFDGSGMILVNPPYLLTEELRTFLPLLAERLGENGHGNFSIAQLTKE